MKDTVVNGTTPDAPAAPQIPATLPRPVINFFRDQPSGSYTLDGIGVIVGSQRGRVLTLRSHGHNRVLARYTGNGNRKES